MGANLGMPVEGKTLEDVIQEGIWPPWIAPIFAMNLRVKSDKAQSQLHWRPVKNRPVGVHFKRLVQPLSTSFRFVIKGPCVGYV